MKRLNNILIIDDDPVFIKLLCKSLNNHSNHTVCTFTSPRDIFNDSINNPFLVYLDYKMEDLNGLSTAKVVRKKWPLTTIVLISESANIRNIKLSRYGIDAGITKDLGSEKIAVKGLKVHRKLKILRMLKKNLYIFLNGDKFTFHFDLFVQRGIN